MLRRSLAPAIAILAVAAIAAGCASSGDLSSSSAAGAGTLLVTALLLGIRHGIDWDHIAAIVDITSTTAAAEAAEEGHAEHHAALVNHHHPHGGPQELEAHGVVSDGPGTAAARVAPNDHGSGPHRHIQRLTRSRFLSEQGHAILLGTLYALGHAFVVAVLGIAALLFGALLPDWVDPIMGRVVGITLIVLGAWVFFSLYQYARHGHEFRLRSRWMLVFDSVRYGWRRIQAALHGHEHVEPVEMSSYGVRTAFGVGMIHGVGAETGSQVLIIAGVGGASSLGLGVPMMFAFIIGLLISNTFIIVVSATGFVASQLRQRIYLIVGVVAGAFSLLVGFLFLFQAEGQLPDLDSIFHFIGS
jgi:high-affinity nickel-transport protein